MNLSLEALPAVVRHQIAVRSDQRSDPHRMHGSERDVLMRYTVYTLPMRCDYGPHNYLHGWHCPGVLRMGVWAVTVITAGVNVRLRPAGNLAYLLAGNSTWTHANRYRSSSAVSGRLDERGQFAQEFGELRAVEDAVVESTLSSSVAPRPRAQGCLDRRRRHDRRHDRIAARSPLTRCRRWPCAASAPPSPCRPRRASPGLAP